MVWLSLLGPHWQIIVTRWHGMGNCSKLAPVIFNGFGYMNMHEHATNFLLNFCFYKLYYFNYLKNLFGIFHGLCLDVIVLEKIIIAPFTLHPIRNLANINQQFGHSLTNMKTFYRLQTLKYFICVLIHKIYSNLLVCVSNSYTGLKRDSNII